MTKSHHPTVLAAIIVLAPAAYAAAGPRVWIADQGNNQGTVNNVIREIDPFNINPIGPDGSNVYVLNTLPSPAGAFLDELTFDSNQRLWCVVKEDPNQNVDGLRRIDKETGAIDTPPGLITVSLLPGWPGRDFLEGAAWDGTGLWITSIKEFSNNVLTRVDPSTGDQIAPFNSGALGAAGFVNIPGTVAQGLLWQPGNNGYGWLWHSDAIAQQIHKLDPALLFDGNDGNDNNITIATFNVPFKPKGMDWMGDQIWVAAPATGPWNPPASAGIWEFNPVTGATQQLFNTPTWNLDGLAILEGPQIVVEPDPVVQSVWLDESVTDDTFTIANGGTDTLNYELNESADWLSVTPTNGSSTGEGDEFTIHYDLADAPVGTYETIITITSPDAINAPYEMTVTVSIITVGPDYDGDGDVDQEDFGYLQRCFSGTGNPQAEPTCEKADLTGDSYVDQSDYQIFAGCMSGASIMADRNCE